MMNNPFSNNISTEELMPLPLTCFKGNIHVIDSAEKINRAISFLSRYKLLGFDTETKPSFKKGRNNNIALLQLSTESDAFLFRLDRIKLNDDIKTLLQDNSITKVGAAINDDLKGLKELSDFQPGGFVELQDFVKTFGIEPNGLKKIAAIVLGIRISKSQQVSNWENPALTESQLLYAATDAWVCEAIYKKLLKYS